MRTNKKDMEFTEEQAEEYYPEHLPRVCIERSSRVYRKKKVTAGTPSSGGERIGQARFVPHRKLRNSRHLGQPKVQTSLIQNVLKFLKPQQSPYEPL